MNQWTKYPLQQQQVVHQQTVQQSVTPLAKVHSKAERQQRRKSKAKWPNQANRHPDFGVSKVEQLSP
jgi:hypothetical protein